MLFYHLLLNAFIYFTDIFFCLHHKVCSLINVIHFLDDVSNFRSIILTNQEQELVARNCPWNCMTMWQFPWESKLIVKSKHEVKMKIPNESVIGRSRDQSKCLRTAITISVCRAWCVGAKLIGYKWGSCHFLNVNEKLYFHCLWAKEKWDG